LLFVILIFSGSVTSCGLSGKRDNTERKEAKGEAAAREQEEEKGKKGDPAALRIVGEIASVHAVEKFVLIKRYVQGGGFGQDILIASVSPEGVTCSLALTGERLGRYYAADIQEGKPSKGDVVVVRQLPEGLVDPVRSIPAAP
jgi:hypothetical protein